MQSKLAESEEKVAAMTVQIEHLHNDRLRLENRNSVLEKVCVLLHGFASTVIAQCFDCLSCAQADTH